MLAPSEITNWVDKFYQECKNTKSARKVDYTSIVHSLVQIGVEDPENCECKCSEDLYDEKNPEDAWFFWLHKYHREYNRTIYEIISMFNLVSGLRRAILRDQKIEIYEDWDSRKEFGKVARKDYGRDLLNNFLWNDRRKVTWI